MLVSGERNRKIRICRRCDQAPPRGLYLGHQEIHALFEEMIHRPWGTARWNPATDVREDPDAFLVEVDLPGVRAEEVQVLVEGRTLAIEGQRKLPRCNEATAHLCERPDGRFARLFEFDREIEDKKIESHWQDGVLTVTIPKSKD